MDELAALVSGASGFLGRYVVSTLCANGRRVCTLDRPGVEPPADIACDLATEIPSLEVRAGGPVEVYHLAGLAHRIPRSELERRAFFEVNEGGTRRLLEALDRSRLEVRFLVLVSTVAVYGREEGWLISEEEPRQASDPYGESKRRAEDAVMEWGARRGVNVGVVRLPLVAGKNPPGNLRAMVRAIRRGWYFGVGSGSARRSMVWAGDVASVLPSVGEVGGVFHLTDGDHPSFAELGEAIAGALGRRTPRRLPVRVANALGVAGDLLSRVPGLRVPVTRATLRKLTATLTFDDARARKALRWRPSPVLEHVRELVS